MRDGERPSQEWRRACGRHDMTWIHQICRDTGVTATGGGQNVLAADRNSERLRLNALHYDDDDDDDEFVESAAWTWRW